MKVLSLHQPYASLIAHGFKRVETRSWGTDYRGVVAIHAAKIWGAEQLRGLADLQGRQSDAIEQLDDGSPIPLGGIVAVARVADCRRMDGPWIAKQTGLELDLGGWEVGRYGWVLEDVRAIAPMIPLRGRQGLFELERRALTPADRDRLGVP